MVVEFKQSLLLFIVNETFLVFKVTLFIAIQIIGTNTWRIFYHLYVNEICLDRKLNNKTIEKLDTNEYIYLHFEAET